MKFLAHIFLLITFYTYAQFDNELKKIDSIFVYFTENKNQKIYSKVTIENSIELKYVTYKFFFDDGKNCNFTINQNFNFDSNGKKVFRTLKLKKSFLKKNKHKIITYKNINEKGFTNYINLLQEKKVYVIDEAEIKGKCYIARGVVFSFVADE